MTDNNRQALAPAKAPRPFPRIDWDSPIESCEISEEEASSLVTTTDLDSDSKRAVIDTQIKELRVQRYSYELNVAQALHVEARVGPGHVQGVSESVANHQAQIRVLDVRIEALETIRAGLEEQG